MAGDTTLELVPGEEYVEIDLPEGMVLPEPQAAGEPLPAPAQPPAPAAPKEGNLGKALQQERAKTKNYKQLWKDAEEKILARKAETRSTVPPGPAFEVAIPEFNLDELVQQADAEAGATMGTHAKLVVGHVKKALTKFATDLSKQLTSHSQLVAFNAALEGQKAACRLLYDDYDETIEQAGFNQDLDVDPRTGLFRNPELAAEVYRDPFPELKKYTLAKGRLEARAPVSEEPPAAPLVVSPVVAAPPPVTPAVVPPAVAEAPPARPPARGIRRIVSAGQPPRTAITREYLGWLLDHDYSTYEKLTVADPRLLKFHLGGIPLDQAG